jgi:hypothetical protein
LASAEPVTVPLRRPRRRSPVPKFLLVLLVAVLALVVLIGALVLVDSALRSRVETEIAARLQSRLATPTAPAVDVGGSPFFLQAVRGDLNQVRVVADNLGSRPGAPDLKVRHLDLTFSHITSDDRFRTATAADASGSAQIDLADLSAIAGTPLTYAGDGRVAFTTTTSVLGRTVDVSASGRPQVDAAAQTITLTDVAMNVGGIRLPTGAIAILQGALLKPIPITGVPLGLRVVAISVSESGLDAQLHGSQVRVAG